MKFMFIIFFSLSLFGADIDPKIFDEKIFLDFFYDNIVNIILFSVLIIGISLFFIYKKFEILTTTVVISIVISPLSGIDFRNLGKEENKCLSGCLEDKKLLANKTENINQKDIKDVNIINNGTANINFNTYNIYYDKKEN